MLRIDPFPERAPEERGFVSPEKDRIAELIASMADLSKGPLFRHKLHKLLFFADLLRYEEKGRSISGLHYFDGEFGPVPERGDLLYEILVLEGVLKKREIRFPASDYFGTAFERGEGRGKERLDEGERAVLERIIGAYKQATPMMLIRESLELDKGQLPFLSGSRKGWTSNPRS